MAGRYDPDIKDIIEVPVLPRLYELSERTDWILTKELQNTMEERKRQHAESGRQRKAALNLSGESRMEMMQPLETIELPINIFLHPASRVPCAKLPPNT